jgi:hypothetical protein
MKKKSLQLNIDILIKKKIKKNLGNYLLLKKKFQRYNKIFYSLIKLELKLDKTIYNKKNYKSIIQKNFLILLRNKNRNVFYFFSEFLIFKLFFIKLHYRFKKLVIYISNISLKKNKFNRLFLTEIIKFKIIKNNQFLSRSSVKNRNIYARIFSMLKLNKEKFNFFLNSKNNLELKFYHLNFLKNLNNKKFFLSKQHFFFNKIMFYNYYNFLLLNGFSKEKIKINFFFEKNILIRNIFYYVKTNKIFSFENWPLTFFFSKQKKNFLHLYKNSYLLFFNKDYLVLTEFYQFLFKNLSAFISTKPFCYFHYRLFGLGFRIKKSFLNTWRNIKLELGFSHILYYFLPLNVKFLRRKRRFLIFGNDINLLEIVNFDLLRLRHLNCYKIRGMKEVRLNIKMKQGKKQTQR